MSEQNRLPQSLETERAIIVSMVTDNDLIAFAVEDLTSRDFASKSYGIIFDEIVKLWDNNEEITPVLLYEKIRSHKNDETTGNIYPTELYEEDFYTKLFQEVQPLSSIKSLCKLVKEKSIQRKLISTCREIVQEAMDPELENVQELLEGSEQKVFEIAQNKTTSDATLRQIAKNLMATIQEATKYEGGISGVRVGFRDLDDITAGFQKSDLIIIGARPSVGKSALALSMALNVVTKFKRRAAFFSLEMSKEQVYSRLISIHAGIPQDKIRKAALDGHWRDYMAADEELQKTGLIIKDKPALTIQNLRAECRRLKAEPGGLDIIFVDYLQLMTTAEKTINRQEEIAKISRGLKIVAKELNIPVVALAQVNRDSEKAEKRRPPALYDIRESGAIEQDADIVCLLYRSKEYFPNESDENKYIIDIAKHRNGKTERVAIEYEAEITKFYDRKDEEDENYTDAAYAPWE